MYNLSQYDSYTSCHGERQANFVNKRLLSVIISAAILAVLLVGCGADSGNSESDGFPDLLSFTAQTLDGGEFTARDFADADLAELEQDIHSTGFYHNKARNIIACCRRLRDDFGGEVPKDIESLTSLPGVGRKTANVVEAVYFDRPAMPVDTHVFRVANRIGLTVNSKTPLQTERELVKYIPEALLSKAHHWLILHGRYVCQARKPKCSECGLTEVCCFFRRQETGDKEMGDKEIRRTGGKETGDKKTGDKEIRRKEVKGAV